MPSLNFVLRLVAILAISALPRVVACDGLCGGLCDCLMPTWPGPCKSGDFFICWIDDETPTFFPSVLQYFGQIFRGSPLVAAAGVQALPPPPVVKATKAAATTRGTQGKLPIAAGNALGSFGHQRDAQLTEAGGEEHRAGGGEHRAGGGDLEH